jgi:hypothetical protein
MQQIVGFVLARLVLFQMSFTLKLNGQFDFSKCRGLAIRGYNKVKLYSTVYSHIRDCEAFDPVLIKPKVVIDAVGTPDPDRGIAFIMYNGMSAMSKHILVMRSITCS